MPERRRDGAREREKQAEQSATPLLDPSTPLDSSCLLRPPPEIATHGRRRVPPAIARSSLRWRGRPLRGLSLLESQKWGWVYAHAPCLPSLVAHAQSHVFRSQSQAGDDPAVGAAGTDGDRTGWETDSDRPGWSRPSLSLCGAAGRSSHAHRCNDAGDIGGGSDQTRRTAAKGRGGGAEGEGTAGGTRTHRDAHRNGGQ